MSKRKGKAKSGPKAQPRSGWPKNLIPGVLVAVVLAGGGSWFLLQKSSAQVVAAQYTNGPRLAVDNELIDFGNVPFGKHVKAAFRLRNVGDQPLRLPLNPPVEAVEGC